MYCNANKTNKLVVTEIFLVSMQYYTQQSTEDVGIGIIISFETEQHPKKHENRVGTLTIRVFCQTQVPRENEDADSAKSTVMQTKMFIEC